MTTCRGFNGQVGFGPFTAQWPDTREGRYKDKRTCKCAKMLVKRSSVARSKQRAEGETAWSSGTRCSIKIRPVKKLQVSFVWPNALSKFYHRQGSQKMLSIVSWDHSRLWKWYRDALW